MADTTNNAMKPRRTNSPKKTPISSQVGFGIPAPDEFLPEEVIKRVMFAAQARTLGKSKLPKPKSAGKPKSVLKSAPKPEVKPSAPQALVVEDVYPDLNLDNISEDGIDLGIFVYPEEEKNKTSDFMSFPRMYLEKDYGQSTYLVRDVPVNSSVEAARSLTRCPILGRFVDGSSTAPATESLDLISAIDQREAQLNSIRPELQKIEEANTDLKSYCERIKEGKDNLELEVESAKCLWSAAETRFDEASLALAEYERSLERNASNKGTIGDIEAIRNRAETHKTGAESGFSSDWNTFYGLSQDIHNVYEKNIQIEKIRTELQLAIKLEQMVLSTNTPDDLVDFEALEELLDNSAKHPALAAEWASISENLSKTIEEANKLEYRLKKEDVGLEIIDVKEPKWATPMKSQSDLLSTKRDEVSALLRKCVILLKRRPQIRKEMIDTQLSVANLRKELKLAEVMAEHFNAEAAVFENSCCPNPYNKIKYVNAGDSSKQHAYEIVTDDRDYHRGLFKKINIADDRVDQATLKMRRMTLDEAMEAGLASKLALFNTAETARSANSLLKKRIRECKADNHLAFEQAKNMQAVLSKLRELVSEAGQVRKENNEARQIKDEVAVREHNVKVGKPFLAALKQKTATYAVRREVLVLKSQPVEEDKPCAGLTSQKFGMRKEVEIFLAMANIDALLEHTAIKVAERTNQSSAEWFQRLGEKANNLKTQHDDLKTKVISDRSIVVRLIAKKLGGQTRAFLGSPTIASAKKEAYKEMREVILEEATALIAAGDVSSLPRQYISVLDTKQISNLYGGADLPPVSGRQNTWSEPAPITNVCAGINPAPKVEIAPKSADYIDDLYTTHYIDTDKMDTDKMNALDVTLGEEELGEEPDWDNLPASPE